MPKNNSALDEWVNRVGNKYGVKSETSTTGSGSGNDALNEWANRVRGVYRNDASARTENSTGNALLDRWISTRDQNDPRYSQYKQSAVRTPEAASALSSINAGVNRFYANTNNLIDRYNGTVSNYRNEHQTSKWLDELNAGKSEITNARKAYADYSVKYSDDITEILSQLDSIEAQYDDMIKGVTDTGDVYNSYIPKTVDGTLYTAEDLYNYDAKYYGKNKAETEAEIKRLNDEAVKSLDFNNTAERDILANEEARLASERDNAYTAYQSAANAPWTPNAELTRLKTEYEKANSAYDSFMANPTGNTGENQKEIDWITENYLPMADYYAKVGQYGSLDNVKSYDILDRLATTKDEGERAYLENYIDMVVESSGMIGRDDYEAVAEAQRKYDSIKSGKLREAIDESAGYYNNAVKNGTEAFYMSVDEGSAATGLSKQEYKDLVMEVAPYIAQRGYEKRMADAQANAKGWDAVSGTIFSYLINPLANIEADTYLLLSQAAGQTPLAGNTSMREYQTVQTTRSAVADNLEKVTNLKIGDTNVASWLYQAVNSTVDSGINMLITSGVAGAAGLAQGSIGEQLIRATVSNAVMGSGAAVDAFIEAKQQGISNNQALWKSVSAGFVEGLTEAIGGETIVNAIVKGEGAITTMIKSALSEGTEEWASNELNRAIGNAFFGEDGAFILRNIVALFAGYKAAGYESKKAADKAFKDAMTEDASSFLAGAFSGLLMGSTGTLTQNINTGRAAISSYGSRANAIQNINTQIENANALNPAEPINILKSNASAVRIGSALRAAQQSRTYSDVRDVMKEISPLVREGLSKQGIAGKALDDMTAAVTKSTVRSMVGEETSERADKLLELSKDQQKMLNSEVTQAAVDGVKKSLGKAIGETAFNTFSRSKAGREDGRIQEGQDAAQYAKDKLAVSRAARVFGDNLAGMREAMQNSKTLTQTQVEAIYNDFAGSVPTGAVEDGKLSLPKSIDAVGAKSLQTIFSGIKDADGRESFAYAGIQAYNAGREYGSSQMARDLVSDLMEKNQDIADELNAAFEQGKKDTPTGKARRSSKGGASIITAEDAKKYSGDGNTINVVDLNKMSKNERKRAQRTIAFHQELGRAIGVNFVFFDSRIGDTLTGKSNGFYDQNTNTVYLDINSWRDNGAIKNNGSVLFTTSHELTHFLANNEAASAEYNALKEFIIDQYYDGDMSKFDAEVQKVWESEKGNIKNEQGAIEEVVARSCEEMLKDTKVFEEFAKRDMNTAQKMAKWLKDFAANFSKVVKSFFGDGAAARTPEAAFMRESAERMQKLQELWDKALLAAVSDETAGRSSETGEQTKESAVQTDGVKRSVKQVDSDGRALSEQQIEYFKDSKVRDENGNLRVVYHGSDADFTVFDRTKSRANMDIQGNFFSPWEIDAAGYGGNVRAFYLNIKNPAPESVAYKALRRFQGQNNAGIKAREYLISLGYDGVNNSDEEYIAFYPEQTKLTTNLDPTENQDIRYSSKEQYSGIDLAAEGSAAYTYAFLKSLPEMRVYSMPALSDVKTGANIDQKKVAELGMKNAFSLGTKITDSVAGVENRYTGRDIRISENGIVHGLDGSNVSRLRTNSRLSAVAGTVVQNGVPINALYPENAQVKGTYALATLMRSEDRYVVAIAHINEYTNNLEDLEFNEVLHSINGRLQKKSADGLPQGNPSSAENPARATSADFNEISIDDFLDVVNSTHQSLLPYDVLLNKYGITEKDTNGYYTSRAKNSLKETSDREILSDALMDAAQTDEERTMLTNYQNSIREYEEKEAQLAKIAGEIKELSFAPGKRDTERIKALQLEANKLRRSINNYDKGLLKLEAAEPLKRVLEREKVAAERRAVERGRDRLREYRINRDQSEAVKKYRKRIEDKVKKLSDELLINSDKKHIPEPLKQPLNEFLQSINFDSKRLTSGGTETQKDIRFRERAQALALALQSYDGSDGYVDLPADQIAFITEQLNAVTRAIDSYDGDGSIYLMDAAQLKRLDNALGVISKAVSTVNEFMANRRYAEVATATQETMNDLDSLGQSKTMGKALGLLKKLGAWDNATPFYAFRRMGSAAQAMFQSIQDGWDKMALNSKRAIDYANSVYTSAQQKAWSEEVLTIELSEKNGEARTVRMTVAQAMSLYCLAKRQQAVGHILGGGIRVGDFEDGRTTVKQADPYTLLMEDVQNIIAQLSDEQRRVADNLQNYMNTVGSEWGNEVSMARFGYKAFGEANYFPITSDPTNLSGVSPEARENDMFRLLNMSSTKSLTKGANNALMLFDIFDVFSNHMSDMAKYNALALPILDMVKWYNYKEKITNPDGTIDTKTLQRSLEKAFGTNDNGAGYATNYLKNFLKDLNGASNTGREVTGLSAFMGRYKKAAVAANLRVAVQQPMSIMRAQAVIDPKWIANGYLNIREGREEMLKYSGIAVWKDLGFYDTNIGRDIAEQIKHDENFLTKVDDASMKLAEYLDSVTWGALWSAAKAEQASKGLTGQELIAATNERFRDIIYASQVVDSTVTRSDIMRSPSQLAKIYTSFMSEPTLTWNMMLDVYMDAHYARRRGESVKGLTSKALRTGYALVTNAAAIAIVTALMDAWRDDDSYETFWEKFTDKAPQNFLDELNPIDKIAVISKAWDTLASDYQNNTVDTAWLNDIKSTIDILAEDYKLMTDPNYKATDATYNGKMTVYGQIYQLLKTASDISGIPVGSLAREVTSAWNNIVVPFAGERARIKTYNESPNTVGFPNLVEAIIEGDESRQMKIESAMAVNGLSDKKIADGIKAALKTYYLDGEIDEDELADILCENCGYEPTGTGGSSINYLIDGWSYGTGYKLATNLEAAFADGDEDEVKNAVEFMRTRYSYDDSKIKSAITSYWKETYKAADEAERRRIRELILATGLYDAKTLDKKLNEWVYAE